MKIILRAAMATLSISGISPAIADEGDGAVGNTYLTSCPGVIAPAPQQAATSATALSLVIAQHSGAVRPNAVFIA